jgi:hypothetical protein
MTKRTIAVLFHEKQRSLSPEYLVTHLAGFWREDGHEVVFLFGTGQFIPADLVLVHVDLSVVPDEYIEFARQYPIVLNGTVKDIRKSTYSRLLVKAGDSYDGKVIVKSNFNYAGGPERLIGVPLDPRGVSSSYFWSPTDYQVYENSKAVPAPLFDDPNVVVEKFQPEFVDGFYHSRAMLFLGDRISAMRYTSREPIVNGSTQIRTDPIEPDPEIVQARETLKFDYGKFDYVIHEGKPVLLDLNKTIGAPITTSDPKILASRRHRAEGLYRYFERGGL